MEESNLDKQGKNKDEKKPERDEKGRLLPGNTANLNGRPKGVTLKTRLREMLSEIPKDRQETYLELMLRDILEDAVFKKSEAMRRLVFNYIEGLPRQTIGLGLEEPIEEVNIKIIRSKDDIKLGRDSGVR